MKLISFGLLDTGTLSMPSRRKPSPSDPSITPRAVPGKRTRSRWRSREVGPRWRGLCSRDAAAVGAGWAGATVAFEFTLGHFQAHMPWSELLSDYNLRRGRLWSLVVATLGVGPSVAFLVRTRKGPAARLRRRNNGRRLVTDRDAELRTAR